MADVFITYAREDKDVAERLAGDLIARGYQVWWDVELGPGDDFRQVILDELKSAKAAIVIWTPNSIRSAFVVDEANYALQNRKLIATRTADLPVSDIPFGFQGQHVGIVTEPRAIVQALTKLGIRTAENKTDAEQHKLSAEVTFWKEIEGSRVPRDFELYLEEYPAGLHRAHAKLKLQRLANPAAEPAGGAATPALPPAIAATWRRAIWGLGAGFVATWVAWGPVYSAAMTLFVSEGPYSAFNMAPSSFFELPYFAITALVTCVWGATFGAIEPVFPRGTAYWVVAFVIGAVAIALAEAAITPLTFEGDRLVLMQWGCRLAAGGAWGLAMAAAFWIPRRLRSLGPSPA
jgi:hypothetical protein